MNRIGFRLQVRPDVLDQYRAHHRDVWPEMREALHRRGWNNYSLFLDGDGTLFGYFETDGTLGDAVRAMQLEPVNERWQALMAQYFVEDGTAADHQMRALDQVFHLP
jgi:L-rhamnose mutarotase